MLIFVHEDRAFFGQFIKDANKETSYVHQESHHIFTRIAFNLPHDPSVLGLILLRIFYFAARIPSPPPADHLGGSPAKASG